MNELVTRIDQRTSDMDKFNKERFDHISNKLDNIDSKIGGVSDTISNHSARLDMHDKVLWIVGGACVTIIGSLILRIV